VAALSRSVRGPATHISVARIGAIIIAKKTPKLYWYSHNSKNISVISYIIIIVAVITTSILYLFFVYFPARSIAHIIKLRSAR
jgi:hypothetical protein